MLISSSLRTEWAMGPVQERVVALEVFVAVRGKPIETNLSGSASQNISC
jgi:hypothetical protein